MSDTETVHAPTTTPSPDLAIIETRVYRGANIWSYERAIHLVVDLGVLEEWPTDRIPGFTKALLEYLPRLHNHTCSRGHKGGFVERLEEGTWLGHVTEHVALQLQQEVGHDLRRGKTRQVPGEPGRYNVIYGYVDENVGIAGGRLAVRLVPSRTSISTLSSRTSSSEPSGPPSARRPKPSSTRRSHATSRGSGSTSTRWSSSAKASTRRRFAPR
jgi:hypothetical protein